MKRGNVVTVATGGGFGGKPRPALVIQADQIDASATVVVALFTTDLNDIPLTRLRFDPSAENGLRSVSDLMIDVIVTARRGRTGRVIGTLSEDEMTRVDRALLVFLGLAG
ncbi:MAG TPA: type II toxin-antitoxin system PemK/MazF family toxin [Allosphingosinicella sp.]|nr:type II toxin-antitoxin system PemK/MazF family toxin [Allosphingosinicella sp.]